MILRSLGCGPQKLRSKRMSSQLAQIMNRICVSLPYIDRPAGVSCVSAMFPRFTYALPLRQFSLPVSSSQEESTSCRAAHTNETVVEIHQTSRERAKNLSDRGRSSVSAIFASFFHDCHIENRSLLLVVWLLDWPNKRRR
jgi:hypothetical protein